MSADTVNRETVRDAFAALLQTALVGVGLPVSEVNAYPKGVIELSPVISVASSGTSRQRAGIGDSRWHSYFVLEVYTFVRDADAANGWTEADVEDTLDLLDKEIADVVADNRVNANWNHISFALDDGAIPEQSQIMTDTQRGYKLEMRKVYIKKMDV